MTQYSYSGSGAMSQVPKHRQLPDKEGKLFKELLVRQHDIRSRVLNSPI